MRALTGLENHHEALQAPPRHAMSPGTRITYDATAGGRWGARETSPSTSSPCSSSPASNSFAVFTSEVNVSVACLSSLLRAGFNCNKPDLSAASLNRRKVLFICSMIDCSCVLCCLSDEMVVSFLCRYARCARRICVLRLYDVVSSDLAEDIRGSISCN